MSPQTAERVATAGKAGQTQAVWSMAATCRATGLGQHTLRVWERRFGFPRPQRLPSGHRRYTEEQVEHLRLIARALAAGHRAGAVVPLEIDALEALLAAHVRIDTTADAASSRLLPMVKRFDRAGIETELLHACAELGARAFLSERVAPLIESIGEAWAAGSLSIRHEHFLTEILVDTLRSLRAPLEPRAPGKSFILATLPGEPHSLGLHMAAMTVALAGRRATILGTQVPVREIVETARALMPVAVGISVTVVAAGEETAIALRELADALPAGVGLWLGGAGCRVVTGLGNGVKRLSTLDQFAKALGSLPPH